jgi:hypothetical protein
VPFKNSGIARPFKHVYPLNSGLSWSPWIVTSRPPTTSAISGHALLQTRHTEWRSSVALTVMGSLPGRLGGSADPRIDRSSLACAACLWRPER